MDSQYVRVRPYSMGGPCAVWVEELGAHEVPNPAKAYRTDDPIVQAAPWMFVTDEQLAALGPEVPVTEVPIEAATARPGERRNVKRR
jgi:hypothetical protein